MFRRRRPLLRAAVVGGGAYVAGKKVAQNSAQKADQDERISNLENQQAQQGAGQPAAAPAADPAPDPAPDPGAAAGASLSDQLKQLNELHESGALSDSEFAAAKRQLLGI